MRSINFDDGRRSFCLNDDPNRVIWINPADIGIMQRLDNVYKRMKTEYDNLSGREQEITQEEFFNFSDKLKNELNYLFASDVADIILAGASPLATVNGSPIILGFLEAVTPIIEEYVKDEASLMEKRIRKYTEDIEDDRQTSDDNQY